MLNLVLKDILLQKKSLMLMGIFCIIPIIIFNYFGTLDTGSQILLAMVISYTLIMGTCAQEFKNTSDIFINSLPLKRSTIVKARYLTAFVFMFYALVVVAIIGVILNSIGFSISANYLGTYEIVGIVTSLILFISIYFPVYFKYGYLKSKLLNFILLFGTLLIPNLVVSLASDTELQEILSQICSFLFKLSSWEIISMLMGSVFIIMLISYFLSVRFYNKREF